MLKIAPDVLVAPRYSSASNMQFRPISSWESVEFAEAEMVEKGTGDFSSNPFKFPNLYVDGTPYTLAVKSASAGQTCKVEKGERGTSV